MLTTNIKLKKVYLKNILLTLIDIAILLSAAFLVIRKTFTNEGLIFIHDAPMPLYFPSIASISYLWNHRSNTGLSSLALSSNWIPIMVLLMALNSIFPTWMLNRFIFFLPFMSVELGVYFFLRVHKRSRLSSLLAGIFASYSPTMASRIIYGQTWLMVQAGGILFFLALYSWLVNRGLSEIRVASLLSLITLMVTSLGNPIPILFLSFSFLVFIVLEIILERKPIKIRLKILCFYAIFSFFLNFWWLLPTLYSMFFSETFYTVGESYAKGILLGTSRASSFIGSFMLYSQDVKYRISYYNNVYVKSFIILCITFPILFSFLRKDLLNAYFSVILVVAVLLFQGVNPPFGKLYQFLYDNLPGFFVFRDVNHFDLLLLISISGLWGSGLDEILKGIKNMKVKKVKVNVVAYVLVLLFFLEFVYWYGNPFLDGTLNGFLAPVEIPSYYFDAIEYLSRYNMSTRVLYPFRNYLTVYKWSKHELTNLFFASPYFPPIVSDKDAISANLPEYARQVIFKVVGLLEKSNNLTSKAIGMLSIGYIITDSSDNVGNVMSSKNITGIVLNKTFGSIYIYKNENSFPLIYVAKNLIYVKGSIDNIENVIALPEFNSSAVVAFSSQVNSNSINSNITLSSETSFKVISATPVRYIVEVNSTGPFFLVFTETFDKGWVAYSDKQSFEHFIANGYANGWFVNKSGSIRITIEFKPQALLYYGSTVSIVTLVTMTTYLVTTCCCSIYRRQRHKQP